MFENLGLPTALPGTLGAVVLAAALSVLPSGAFAKKNNDARIKSFSFSASQSISSQGINVISTNGERWNKIAPGNIQLKIDAEMKINRRGAVNSSGLFLGACSKTLCGGNPLIEAKPSLPINPTNLDTAKIPVSGSGIAPVPYGDQMIRACNQYLTDGPREAHGFTWPITVTLSVDTSRKWKRYFSASDLNTFSGGDVSRQSTFRVKVNCVPYPSMIRGADPVEVKLTVEPRQGNACPRNTKIKTRIVYHYKKTATFDIMRNGKKIKTVKINAKKVKLTHGPSQWVINREDIVKAEAGQNRFRIKVKGGGQSQVQTANIECAPFQVMSARLQYNVAGVASSASCPVKVWETTTFTTNGPGNLVYQLVRKTNGSVALEKSLKPILKNGVYKLVGQRVLTISKSVDREFRVQVKGKSGNNSSWARLKVDCAAKKGKAAAGAATGVKTAPKKAKAKQTQPRIKTAPKKPKAKQRQSRIKIAPLPKKSKRKLTKLICRKGKVRAGKCYCGARRKQVRTGKRSYICKTKPRIKTAPSVNRVKPRKRKIGKRCGPRKVLVRGRCIRRAG